jgi:hypothetical protein
MMRRRSVAAIAVVGRNTMPHMKPPSNPLGPRNPNGVSNWLLKISEAGTAQDMERRRPHGSRRSKSVVEMVEDLKKHSKK